MNNTFSASLLLLAALVIAGYAIVTLIRQSDSFGDQRRSASQTYYLTWALAAVLAAVGLTWLLDLRWFWIGLFTGAGLLAGWYIKWFGVPVLGVKFFGKPAGWHALTAVRDGLPRRRISRGLLIWSFVWVCFSLVLMGVTSLELDHETSLEQDGVRTTAAITDYRISTRVSRYSSSPSCDVQYQFSPDDGVTEYTSSDATGRTNLWRSISRSEYDTVTVSGKIEVLYWPQDPWVNRPVASTAADLGTLVILDLMWLGSAGLGYAVSRKYIAQHTGRQLENSHARLE